MIKWEAPNQNKQQLYMQKDILHRNSKTVYDLIGYINIV